MTIEITKETGINGVVRYRMTASGATHAFFETLEEAMKELDIIRKNKKASTEVVYTEEI